MSGQYIFNPPPPPPSATRQQSSEYDSRARSRGDTRTRVRGRGGLDSFSSRPLPRGSFVNPNYTQLGQQTDKSQDHARPASKDGKQHTSTSRSFPSTQSHHNDQSFPPRTVAGHKRKLEALRESDCSEVKTVRPGPEAVPSVPAFGSSLISEIPTKTTTSAATKEASQPRRSLFGLDKSKDNDSSDDSASDKDADDDVDGEEAMYAQLGNKLVFEYGGTVVKLNSEADLARWQEERRQRWPTSARVSEKEQQRRQCGEERRRLLAGAYALRNPAYKARLSTLGHDRDARNGRSRNELDNRKQTTECSQITEQASQQDRKTTRPQEASHDLVASDGNKLASGLPGMAMYDTEDDSDAPEEQSSKSAIADRKVEDDLIAARGNSAETIDVHQPVTTMTTEDVTGADKTPQHAADDFDDAPEEVSSKAAATDQRGDIKGACKYYFSTGECKEGDACKFNHIANPDRPLQVRQQTARNRRGREGVRRSTTEGKKGIHQLLIDQENAADNKLALQAIKYLGSIGFFNA